MNFILGKRRLLCENDVQTLHNRSTSSKELTGTLEMCLEIISLKLSDY